MAYSLSNLAEGLRTRLGLTSTSATQDALITEAIQSAYSRELRDGAPGLTHVVAYGKTLGEVTYFLVDGSVTDNVLTVTEELYVAAGPGDLIKVAGSGDYLPVVRAFEEGGSYLIQIGADVADAASVPQVDVLHRGFRIPFTGTVNRVTRKNHSRELNYDPYAAHTYRIDQSGEPRAFQVHEVATGMVISLWPAPGAGDEFVVSLSSDSLRKLNLSEAAADAVKERAHLIYLTWVSSEPSLAVHATKDVRDNHSGPIPVFER